jgi:anaerobic sulfite reductase subunit C
MVAFSRGEKLYRIVIGGRTGKRNPRLANTFIKNASEEVVLGICKNVYTFMHLYIDRSLPKEHMGYIIDRAGFEVFSREVLAGIKLNRQAKISEPLNPGYFYRRRA